MATEPDYGTPAWFNEIAQRALKRILALAEPAVRQYVEGGIIGGYAPLSLENVKKMPIQTGVMLLTNMMNLPSTRALGVSMFASYLTWLESTGQLQPGAAKMLASQAAGAQVRGELM